MEAWKTPQVQACRLRVCLFLLLCQAYNQVSYGNADEEYASEGTMLPFTVGLFASIKIYEKPCRTSGR